VGVGPHPRPWPTGPRFDPTLLADGDRRNVIDPFRYWSDAAIRTELAARAHQFYAAAEDWTRDPNIGALVRNANAFGAAGVWVVGRRRWNRRGAMGTDHYLPVGHLDGPAALIAWARVRALPLVVVDNVPGAAALFAAELPRACVFVFGSEGAGTSAAVRDAAHAVIAIGQYGSTRSINAAAASAVVFAEWCRRFASGAGRPGGGG
jgi:tRNA G18 (ribose-2'-O)-methylase SpoU